MTTEPLGWLAHLAIAGCNDCVEHKRLVGLWLEDLILTLDVRRLGPAAVEYADTPEPGISAVRMLQTSHVAGHFCAPSRTGYVTVFSCMPFDIEAVAATTWCHFRHQAETRSVTPVFKPCLERAAIPSTLFEARKATCLT